jgi:type IV secretory pathway VirB10-like protein
VTESTFVSPRGYQARGGVPRRMLGGILAVLVVVAIVVYWMTGGNPPDARGLDAQARMRLADSHAVEAQPRGSSRSVDEAAERAAAATHRAAVQSAAPAASISVGPGDVAAAQRQPSEPDARLPALLSPNSREPSGSSVFAKAIDEAEGRPAGRGDDADRPTAREAGASARDLAARSGEGRIFDEPTKGIESSWPSRRREVALEGTPRDSTGGTDAAAQEIASAPLPSTQPLPVTSEQAGVGEILRQLAPAAATRDPAQRAEQWQSRAGSLSPPPALVPRPPAGTFVIEEGTVIPAVLTRRIDSDAPGVVTAMVNMNVFDSRRARALLLPKGSRLVGRYNDDVATGQERMQFAFTRLIMPDGSSFDLPGAVGSDAAGQAGLAADVDRHFLQSFGAALLIGVIADRVVNQRAVPAPNAYGGGLSATGQVLVNTADAELHRNESIPPTLTVAEGTRLNVEVIRDMVFSQPYSFQP